MELSPVVPTREPVDVVWLTVSQGDFREESSASLVAIFSDERLPLNRHINHIQEFYQSYHLPKARYFRRIARRCLYTTLSLFPKRGWARDSQPSEEGSPELPLRKELE